MLVTYFDLRDSQVTPEFKLTRSATDPDRVDIEIKDKGRDAIVVLSMTPELARQLAHKLFVGGIYAD